MSGLPFHHRPRRFPACRGFPLSAALSLTRLVCHRPGLCLTAANPRVLCEGETMSIEPVTYVREGQNTWHVARPADRLSPEVVTLGRRAPVTQWDKQTTERPAPLCKRCAKLVTTR